MRFLLNQFYSTLVSDEKTMCGRLVFGFHNFHICPQQTTFYANADVEYFAFIQNNAVLDLAVADVTFVLNGSKGPDVAIFNYCIFADYHRAANIAVNNFRPFPD